MDPHSLVWIALGANLPGSSGNPETSLNKAMEYLAAFSGERLLRSCLYKSLPKNCPPDSPVYINAVVGLVPEIVETPLSLLRKLQDIEQLFGRVRTTVINEARVMDLDLLWFAGNDHATAELTLPHPRAHERRFVLQPWIELGAGELGLKGRTLKEWLCENTDPELTIVVEKMHQQQK